jgi:hypothetical protein
MSIYRQSSNKIISELAPAANPFRLFFAHFRRKTFNHLHLRRRGVCCTCRKITLELAKLNDILVGLKSSQKRNGAPIKGCAFGIDCVKESGLWKSK